MSDISVFAAKEAAADVRIESALTVLGKAAIPASGRESRRAVDLWIVNSATVPLGVNFNSLIVAIQVWADNFFNPAWGLAVRFRTGSPPAGAWIITFIDSDPSTPGALGYHDQVGGVP